MGLEMVLNDLSLLPLAENKWAARERMEKLVSTLQAATKLGAERILRTDRDIHGMDLAPGYSIALWRNDSEVDKETRQYFKRLITKAPYLEDVDDLKVLETYYSSDFFHEQQKAVGLGMAFLLDALAISFHSHSVWEMSLLQLSLEQLLEDGTVDSDIVLINHACFREHVLEHRDWISKRIQIEVESGTDLCTYYEMLYPHLQFCTSAITQMQALPRGDIHLRQIMKHLLDLNTYCETWQAGPFSAQDIPCKISVESEISLKTYKDQHTFLCPDGEKRVFSWHCRVTPEPWRTYFYPLEPDHTVIIGYIGKHLPTVKFHA
jgi:hypothetical protein